MTEGTKANSSADGFGFGKAFQEQIDAASRDYILEPRLGELKEKRKKMREKEQGSPTATTTETT